MRQERVSSHPDGEGEGRLLHPPVGASGPPSGVTPHLHMVHCGAQTHSGAQRPCGVSFSHLKSLQTKISPQSDARIPDQVKRPCNVL